MAINEKARLPRVNRLRGHPPGLAEAVAFVERWGFSDRQPPASMARHAWLGGSGVWRRYGKKPCQAQRFLIRLLTQGK